MYLKYQIYLFYLTLPPKFIHSLWHQSRGRFIFDHHIPFLFSNLILLLYTKSIFLFVTCFHLIPLSSFSLRQYLDLFVQFRLWMGFNPWTSVAGNKHFTHYAAITGPQKYCWHSLHLFLSILDLPYSFHPFLFLVRHLMIVFKADAGFPASHKTQTEAFRIRDGWVKSVGPFHLCTLC